MLTTAADDSITLHYQPLADCRGRVVGFEALMRWHHRQRGPISPEAFIPIFEQNGLILPLSRWALHQACADAASWPHPLQVSLNLSVVQLQQEDLPALVSWALAETGLAPGRLELEMTEGAIGADPDRARAMLSELSAMGVHIALDDFGLGQFPAAFLTRFPFTSIKIERRFVASIETSAAAQSVVHMTVELGHSQDLVVAAKGVETPGQLSLLHDGGCDLMQGFLIGRPTPIVDFAALTGGAAPARIRPVRLTRSPAEAGWGYPDFTTQSGNAA
jgi:EAL domain-containing protein (putative c-di-GMP-specific phosphodiesterase class I)